MPRKKRRLRKRNRFTTSKLGGEPGFEEETEPYVLAVQRKGPKEVPTHRGYTIGAVRRDAGGMLCGEIANFHRHRMFFYGSTEEELIDHFRIAVEHYLDQCALHGESPEKPSVVPEEFRSAEPSGPGLHNQLMAALRMRQDN